MRARLRGLAAPLLVLALCAGAAHAGGRPALDTRGADALAARAGGGRDRTRALERWADAASLADLVWVLRHGSGTLGDAEPILIEAALRRTPPVRAALRRRLVARLGPGAWDSKSKRAGARAAAPDAAALARPEASVFRVAALLPDSGDYADFAREVRAGLAAGLASIPSPAPRAPQLEVWPTGDDDPARAAASLEVASERSGVLVGELLSVNTFALGTGARMLGLPLVSPTATDENVGKVGPGVFQIGPSGWSRGQRLARAVVDRPGLAIGLLVGGEPDRSAFALGFAAAAESLGATIAWRSGYPAGTAFRDEVHAVGAHRLDVLLWDGESREAEALLRELARQKVSVRLCGGEGLAPDRMHSDARLLLEGVRYVADEWKLAESASAALDSVVRAAGGTHASALHVRGWLAGRAIASAVAGGALCPEEVTAVLVQSCGPPPWLASHHFLDATREGATLPLFFVQHGRAVPLPE